VRIVRVALDHHGLTEAVELVSTVPFDEKGRASLLAMNPLGKIPALRLDDGEVLFDSSVIVSYIDDIGHGSGLFDSDDLSPYYLRTLYAMTNGMLDAAVASVMEVMQRPEEERSPKWLARWEENILASVEMMAAHLDRVKGTGLIPEIAFVVALDYLQFRLGHIDWQSRHPALADWVKEELEQDIYRATDPRLA
jgi:glutathione S-transferase